MNDYVRPVLGIGERQFRRDHGFACFAAIGGVAGVVHYTLTRNKADQLQSSLDASALAIATKYFSGMSEDELTTVGRANFDADMVTGFVYAPGAHIFYAGNFATTSQSACLRLIGKTIELTGNSDFKSDCTAALGGRTMFAGRYMSIVR